MGKKDSSKVEKHAFGKGEWQTLMFSRNNKFNLFNMICGKVILNNMSNMGGLSEK